MHEFLNSFYQSERKCFSHSYNNEKQSLRFEVYNAFSDQGPNAKSLTNKLQQKVAIKSWLKKVVVHTCAFCILTHRKIVIFAMAGG